MYAWRAIAKLRFDVTRLVVLHLGVDLSFMVTQIVPCLCRQSRLKGKDGAELCLQKIYSLRYRKKALEPTVFTHGVLSLCDSVAPNSRGSGGNFRYSNLETVLRKSFTIFLRKN